jgi:RNA polymerase sigma-70 factor (ECF subfamily)
MSETATHERFEQAILPHLDAAYNLKRRLMQNDQNAKDATQDACLRAFCSFDGYQGGSMRAWWLTILRNTCYTLLRKNRRADSTELFDEEIYSSELSSSANPDGHSLSNDDNETLNCALEELPDVLRETIVPREIEGISHMEIAEVTSVPIGTVMSRLVQTRTHLLQSLSAELCRGY